MGHINFSFPSYNVKGMLSSKKHLKQYFKSKLKPSGLLFFKRSNDFEKKCDFGGDLHFSNVSSI